MPRITFARSAFVFAIVAAAAQQSELDKWGSIAAIVACGIALFLFVGAGLREFWRWLRRPNLVVVCRNSEEFHRYIALTDPKVQVWAMEKGDEILAARAKLLRVRETKGSVARNVSLRVTRVEPPAEAQESWDYKEFLPQSLRWMGESETTDIQPHGQGECELQRVIIVRRADGRHKFTTHPGVLGEFSPLVFTLEVLIEGKKHGELRFRIENGWPGLDLVIEPREGEPYPPEPFPYPKVVPVVATF